MRKFLGTAVVLATCGASAFAQSEYQVRTLGGASRFSAPMHSVDDLRNMTNANRTQITAVLTTASLSQLSGPVLDALTSGRVSDTTIAPSTHFVWMAFKRRGTPVVEYNARWVGSQPFDAWTFSVDNAGYTYTFAVPKVCGNLTLVSRAATPVVAAPPAPPRPAPPPPQPPVARVSPPPPPPPPAIAPAPAPTEYFGWTATGFIGSYFETAGQAGAEHANASMTYGGEVSKFWGHVGAQLLADFAPTYKANTAFLSEHPEVNTYMGNVIAIWSPKIQNYVQPYASGGVGAIQMHTSVLAAAARTDNVSDANVKVWSSRFGWNLGGGIFAFAGRAVGFRADVRYFSATNSSDLSTEGPPALRITEELTSGLSFWRANIGVAFRW
jgi:hypothetical protein